MFAAQIISKKRDGAALSSEEIRFLIDGMVGGSVPEYQISAWAMAVYFQGMNATETADLTRCMLESGETLAPPATATESKPTLRVDKHSTGGLGDKVSLILAPLLATFDLYVPMLSGRGLGITGGTLDKLESYEGFRCDLSEAEIASQLESCGCVITGTTPNIAPADKTLYGLRDVTGTVPSVPLITASILSKKLAESLDGLVFDVKFGSGSFMKTADQAKELSASLRSTAAAMGLPASSILSSMEQPLGEMVGNACEANESIEVLQGRGPADVLELTIELAADLLCATATIESRAEAFKSCSDKLDSGLALERFIRMVEAQGGQFLETLPLSQSHIIEAANDGWLHRVDGTCIGNAIISMGGGRSVASAAVNHKVGLRCIAKIGDRVERGQPLAEVYCDDETAVQNDIAIRIENAFGIEVSPCEPVPLILSHEHEADQAN
ncbi:MAG: thymidine phosphorylase [Planctomycetota bacterium]